MSVVDAVSTTDIDEVEAEGEEETGVKKKRGKKEGKKGKKAKEEKGEGGQAIPLPISAKTPMPCETPVDASSSDQGQVLHRLTDSSKTYI